MAPPQESPQGVSRDTEGFGCSFASMPPHVCAQYVVADGSTSNEVVRRVRRILRSVVGFVWCFTYMSPGLSRDVLTFHCKSANRAFGKAFGKSAYKLMTLMGLE